MSQTRHIRLSKSCIGSSEKQAVMEVLDAEYLGMGSFVSRFEEKLSKFFGRPAVCVSTGTAALQFALQACGIGRGDEVLVPSLTYVASFQALSATGALPVACDVDPITMLLDLEDARARMTSKTRAVMPVHYTGGADYIDEVYKFAADQGLRVVEDAAHAFGTKVGDRLIGSFGDVSCFSFDGIKNITSGEGGCLVSDDSSVISAAQDIRLLGVTNDTERRYAGERSWAFDVNTQGWRGHMSNIMAAIGIAQFDRLGEFASARQSLAKRYDDLLFDLDAIQLIPRDYMSVVPHIYVVLLNENVDRVDLREQLLNQGIETGIHYLPNHMLSFYGTESVRGLPNTEHICDRLLTLPLHPDLSLDDVDFVCNQLRGYL